MQCQSFSLTTPETTPDWYTPKTVIWANRPGRRAAYLERVALGTTHIRRECRTHIAHTEPTLEPSYTVEQLRGLVEWAVGEYALLAEYGIQVPPDTHWHIAEFEGRNRLVARVAVIEGVQPDPSLGSPYSVLDRLTRYRACQAPGYRLGDIADDQCLVGRPRLNAQQVDHNTGFWMVDLDLCQWEHGAEE